MTQEKKSGFFSKLKKPFKHSRTSSHETEKGPKTPRASSGGHSATAEVKTSYEVNKPLIERDGLSDEQRVVTRTTRGKVLRLPPAINRTPIPKDVGGDFSDKKKPVDEKVIRGTDWLQENSNPLYKDRAANWGRDYTLTLRTPREEFTEICRERI